MTLTHLVVTWLNDNSFSCQHRLTRDVRVALQTTEMLDYCLLSTYTVIKSITKHYSWFWLGLLFHLGFFSQMFAGFSFPWDAKDTCGVSGPTARKLQPPLPSHTHQRRCWKSHCWQWLPETTGKSPELRRLLNTVQTTPHQIRYEYFKIGS